MDTTDIRTEMDRVRADFRELVDSATVRELRRPTNGTKWTNEQLLFHMVFGYLLVRNLLVLVRGFSRLPDGASRRFATTLAAIFCRLKRRYAARHVPFHHRFLQ